MPSRVAAEDSVNLRIEIREFCLPPVVDALVIGRNAPIGAEAMQRALTLLHSGTFERLDLKDSVIDAVLIRRGILRRIASAKLLRVLRNRVKPLMGDNEVIHLRITADVTLEEQV